MTAYRLQQIPDVSLYEQGFSISRADFSASLEANLLGCTAALCLGATVIPYRWWSVLIYRGHLLYRVHLGCCSIHRSKWGTAISVQLQTLYSFCL